MGNLPYDDVAMLGPLSLDKVKVDGDWYLVLKQDFKATNGGAVVPPPAAMNSVCLREEWSTVPQNIKDAVVALFARAENGAKAKINL